MGAGTGRIEVNAAAEMDDGSVLGERGEFECGERDEGRNDVVASATTILTILRLFWREFGNDECILREETKVVISASFGGEQLYRRRFNIERGQELRETHATRLALFPAYQGEVSTLASCTSENLIRERVFSVKTLQWPRIRLMDAIKMMGCSARGCAGGKAEQSYFQGMMSVNGAILVRFRSLDVTLLVTNEGNGREDRHAVSAVMKFHEP